MSGNGTKPTNGTESPQPENETDEELDEVNLEDIDLDDTSQLNIANLRAVLSETKKASSEHLKQTRMAYHAIKNAADTKAFRTGKTKK